MGEEKTKETTKTEKPDGETTEKTKETTKSGEDQKES